MPDPTTVLDPKPAAPVAAPKPAAAASPTPAASDTQPQPAPASPDPGAVPQPGSPEWVEAAARGDAKRAERLQRFTDPGALFDSYTELEKRLSDRGTVRIPDDKATDEDREIFRKLTGVPETPDGYKLPKEITSKLDDEDTAVLSMVTAHAHKSGGIMSHPAVVKGIHEAYLMARDEAAAQMLATAEQRHIDCQAALDKEWGPEKTRNLGFAEGVLGRYGGDEARELLKLPMADGSRLGDYVPLIRMLSKIGAEVGEDPLFAEASRNGGDALESMESERDKIMALRTAGKFREYDAKQQRLLELNAAIQRHGQKRK